MCIQGTCIQDDIWSIKCIQGLQQYVYQGYMYSISYNLKTSVHKVYPGSTAVCVSRVHAFKIIYLKTSGAQKVYPGSTAVCVSREHVFMIV